MIRPINFKRAIYCAKYKGYLERKEDYYQITELGRERLSQLIPTYETKRPWDGLLYLITYDIPEEKKRDRDYLRDYLKKLGCGMLQKSVWLTPYNPTGVLLEFIKEKKLTGLVLISELKEGGLIGGKNALEVVRKVYNLDEINSQYRHFCLEVDKRKIKGGAIILKYLSILKKDPQLPFELLSPDWWGEDAYEIFKREIKKINLKKT